MLSAYWTIHLHNARALNGDTLILDMDLVDMRPNNALRLSTLNVQWQVYITSPGLFR
jgi:hypothetical protein